MAGSGTFGPSSLKLGSGLPSMFEIQDIVVVGVQEREKKSSIDV